jgi:hypothetical protein
MRYFRRRVQCSEPYVHKISEYSIYSAAMEMRSLKNTAAVWTTNLPENVG